MWYTLPANTPLYRASRAEDTWADVLLGLGSYFGNGGRYNRPGQQTVYASPDPVVALAEFGWHTALVQCERTGDRTPLAYPLVEGGKLWRFHLTTPLELVDVTAPAAAHQFGYPAHMPHNPHPDRYDHGRAVADRLRQWARPPAPHTRPEGIVAPSVRTPAPPGYAPRQVVLFWMPTPVVPTALDARGVLLDSWDVGLEFRTPAAGRPVTAVDPSVAWLAPWCRLAGGAGAVPRYPGRPGSRALRMNAWHPLPTQYSPY